MQLVPRLEDEKDVDILRQAAKLLDRENQKLTQKIVDLTRENLSLKGQDPGTLQMKIAELEQQLAMARARQYGDSSEKRPRGEKGAEKTTQIGHGPREQKELEPVDVPHDLDEADKVCKACGGALAEIEGQFEESEEVDVLERRFVLKKHKRKKYRCACGGCIETAPPPPKLAPGGRYSIDFAIEVAIGKYLDHLPLERQVRIMRREGLVVDSQTLWDQIERLARHLREVYRRIGAHVLGQAVVGADETRWRLMGASGKDEGEATRWQVWTACASDAVYYAIEDSRSADAAEKTFAEYEGTLVCDGYSAYGALQKRKGKFRLAHCWAHVRRKFVEIEDFFPERCALILDLIAELYAAEAACPRGADGDALRAKVRSERSREIVANIQKWAIEMPALPESGLGKAIAYMTGIWSGLTVFLEDPRVPLDNNATERALRGVVIGRKNHYGSRSRRGTEVAALLYSIVETAKLVGVEPKAYLRAAVLAALREEQLPLPHEFTRMPPLEAEPA
jgi:transposase